LGFNLAFNKKPRILNAQVVVNEIAVSMRDEFEGEKTTFLQNLESEEANLRKEKQELVFLREKLQSKLQKEVENKKMGNKKLRAEIADLKIECEKLSMLVRASQNLQILGLTSKETLRQTMKNRGYSEKAIEEIWKWYKYTEVI
jgi:hypothetical protein